MTNNHPTPHDHFFRSMMKNQKVVHEFFATHLPGNIKNIVDLNNLQLDHTSYISDDLREQVSDLLFKADFSGSSGYIYILVEHQSVPEKLMPFRILKYMIAIMDDHLKLEQNNTLPIVYPMIFYSGANPYNYSTDLFDLFGNRELAMEILWQPYQLIDLSKTLDSKLDPLLHYGTLAKIMKYIHRYKKDILLLLEQNMEKLREIDNSDDFGYIIAVMRYCFVVGEVPDKNKFKEVIQRGLSKSGDKIMTFAEQLRVEGYQQGVAETRSFAEQLRVEGYQQGVAETRSFAEQLRIEGYQQGINQGIDQGISQGIVQGINRGKIEIATKLLQQNLDVNLVANSTGLPLAQILELEKKVKKTA